MSENKWTIQIHGDTAPLDNKLARSDKNIADTEKHLDMTEDEVKQSIIEMKKQIQEVKDDAEATKRAVAAGAIASLQVMQKVVNASMSIIRAIGGTIDPIFEALFTMITTTVITLYEAAAAYSSNVGFGTAMALIITVAATIFSVYATIRGIQGEREATAEINTAIAILDAASGAL